MKRRVYIAGPISKGDIVVNVQQASAAFFGLLKGNVAPWCPHWSVYAGGMPAYSCPYPEATPSGTCHADWMGVDLPWVAVAEAVLRIPGESTGADAEVAEAKRLGIPVFESVAEVLKWAERIP